LSNNDRKTFGFRTSGNNVEITSLMFSIISDAPPSCNEDLTLSIAGNDDKLFQNYKYTNTTCGIVNRGCFNRNIGTYDLNPKITNTPFCEKMNFSVAPAVIVGARVQNSSKVSPIKMEMFGMLDNELQSFGSCILPKHLSNIQELNCTIAHPTKKGEYIICISTDNAITDYRINAEQASPTCGSFGIDSGDSSIDYDIFAQALQFDSLNLTVNETTYEASTGNSLVTDINDYIETIYDRNCTSSNGCIIPFELKAVDSQIASISNVRIEYDATNLPGNFNSNAYSIEKINSTITSKFFNLDIEKAGFTLPITTSKKTLQFILGGKTIPKTWDIIFTPGFNYDLSPRTALVGIDTTFWISTSTNLTSVTWDFGDETNVVTTQNKNIAHRYLQEGTYTIAIEAISKSDVSVSKTFEIFVGDPQVAADTLIKKFESNIANLSRQIESYPLFIRNELAKKINISDLNTSLQGIKNGPYLDQNYSEAVTLLISLNVPKAILIKSTGTLPLEIGFNDIDASFIEALSNDSLTLSAGQKDTLKQNLINWNIDNYNSQAEFKIFLLQTESLISEPLFTYFKLNSNFIGNNQKSVNLVINYPKDLVVFSENYGQNDLISESSGVAVPFSGSKTLEFILPSEVQVNELGAFIAPQISELGINNEDIPLIPENDRPSKAKWYFIGVIVLFILLYILLQEWYKRRYESFLFKNKDDLYNLINFIFNSRISGLKNEEIRRKLNTFNWKSEQLTYAFKKLDGKRTGMWEIPIFKFIENRKVRKEIEKRQEQNSNGQRFIKRAY